MDETAVTAINKLFKKSAPLKLKKYKYEIEERKEELSGLEVVLKSRSRNSKLLPFKKLGRRPVEKKIEQVKETIEKLSGHEIDAVLTSVSEEEHFQIQHYYTLQKIAIERTRPEGLTKEGDKDFDDATKIVCDNALQAKHVQVIVKKKEKKEGRWERYFAMEEVIKLNPNLMLDILTEYYKEFQLSEEELKKSLAPTKKEN